MDSEADIVTSGAAPEVTVMKLAELNPAPYNPRKISDDAADGLRASIRRFGLVQPIVWNRRTKRVVGGHQRIDALRALGKTDAQVVVVDLPELEEKALNVTLNNPSITGEFTDGLQAILAELSADPEIGFEELRLDSLLQVGSDGIIEDNVPEPPSEPVTQPGNLWLLGEHRLLCGDSTLPEDVAKVLDGSKPLLMVTDPPYGVDYDPTWRARAGVNLNPRKLGLVANDDRADWAEAWQLFPGDVAYVWHAGLHASEVHASLVATGFELRGQIIWAKDRFALGRGDYHWQHEPCWYAVRRGASALRTDDRSQSTLWEVPAREDEGHGHGTQKPVEVMARPIRNHKAPEVYDPFMGSGTTLIAAEQLGRLCLGIEIHPAYCDVVVARWEALTGGQAERA